MRSTADQLGNMRPIGIAAVGSTSFQWPLYRSPARPFQIRPMSELTDQDPGERIYWGGTVSNPMRGEFELTEHTCRNSCTVAPGLRLSFIFSWPIRRSALFRPFQSHRIVSNLGRPQHSEFSWTSSVRADSNDERPR